MKTRLPRVALAALTLQLAACMHVQVQRGFDDDAATGVARALLRHGAAAWNAGDLDGFMADYLPDATFVTPQGLVRGASEIRALYERGSFAPGRRRGALRFEDLDAHALAPDVIHLTAWYVLEEPGGETARGPTSLVLRRVDGRWRIAHDHSS